jgi:hypothetical protein
VIPDEEPIERATPGHNSGSLEATSVADMREILAGYEQRKDEFLKSAGNAVVRSRETVGDAGDVIHLAAQIWDRIDAQRRVITDPFLEAGRSTKAIADEFWAPVVEAMEELQGKIDDWKLGENKRIADQRAEQDAEMQRLRAPAVTPGSAAPAFQPVVKMAVSAEPKKRKIRGFLGSTVSDVDQKTYEIEDITKIPDWVLNSNEVKAAILSVAKRLNKTVGDIPGVTVTTTLATRVK